MGGEGSAYSCLEPSERKATRPAREERPPAWARNRAQKHTRQDEPAIIRTSKESRRPGEAIAASGRGPAAPTPDAAAFADGWLAAAAASGQDPILQTRFLSGRPRRRSNPAQAPFSPVSAPVPSPEQETAASFFLLSRPAAFGFASQFSPGTDRAGHFTRHPWQQQKAVRHELKKARSKRLVRAGSTYGAPN